MLRAVIVLAALLASCGSRSNSAPGVRVSAETHGDSIVVRWSPPGDATDVKSGSMHIDDGGMSRELPLTFSQVSSDSLSYTPVSAVVKFRLDLNMKNGQRLTQSVQVLNSANWARIAAMAPAKPMEPITALADTEADRQVPETTEAPDFRLPARGLERFREPRTVLVWYPPPSAEP